MKLARVLGKNEVWNVLIVLFVSNLDSTNPAIGELQYLSNSSLTI